MFRKILVANRGEIAVRAFRAATELGVGTVAVFPYEDRFAEYRLKADESYQLGEIGHPAMGQRHGRRDRGEIDSVRRSEDPLVRRPPRRLTLLHLDGSAELFDALVRDHLATYPDHLLAAWLAGRRRASATNPAGGLPAPITDQGAPR